MDHHKSKLRLFSLEVYTVQHNQLHSPLSAHRDVLFCSGLSITSMGSNYHVLLGSCYTTGIVKPRSAASFKSGTPTMGGGEIKINLRGGRAIRVGNMGLPQSFCLLKVGRSANSLFRRFKRLLRCWASTLSKAVSSIWMRIQNPQISGRRALGSIFIDLRLQVFFSRFFVILCFLRLTQIIERLTTYLDDSSGGS